jgi:predicted enzyme related to lactoylglutathione lyase
MESVMSQLFQIDYLELPSANGIGTRRFLEEAFGWQFVDYGATYTGIEAAGIEAGIDCSESRTANALPVIRCSDLVAAEKAVLAAGGAITRPAFDFPGGRRFHFREPGGVEMAVYISTEG